MPILSKPTSAAHLAIIYVTVGALMDVWSGIWYVYMSRHQDAYGDSPYWYVCYGFLLTGLVLMVIGFALGRIGRSARKAELPPSEVTGAAARAEQNAAAQPPILVPMGTPMPGQVVGYQQPTQTPRG